MSRINNNYSVLPWYSDVKYQDYKKWWSYDAIWPLICPDQRLPAFQVLRTTNLGDTIDDFTLIHAETGATTDITADINTNGLTVEQFAAAGYDLITYAGTLLLSTAIDAGTYYARMGDGVNTWYSEVFCMKDDISELIELRYWHDQPFPLPDQTHISYAPPFYNTVYIDSVIAKPRYLFEEETESIDGYEHIVDIIRKKEYRFTLRAPEYMCDVLTLIPLHHYVTIIWDGLTYIVDKINLNPEWLDQGHLARVEVEFITNTVVQSGGYIKEEGDIGDYDQSDYNDDFYTGN